MKRYFFILLFVFSCASTAQKKEEIPAWFYEVKPHNGNLIYGTGASAIKEDAVNNALSNALSVIKTNISSTFTSDSQIVNGKLSESMRAQAVSEVEKFSLSGYSVLRTDYVKQSKMYYVEVAIDKFKIYNEKLDEYNAKMESLRNNYESVEKSSTILMRLDFAKNLNRKAESLKKDASLLRALNSSFNYTQAIAELNKFESYKFRLLNEIGFVVEGGERDVNNALNTAITSKKLRTSGASKINITYKLGESTAGKVYNSYFVKSNIVIFITDATGELSKSSNITFNGNSVINPEEAQKASLQDLTKKFEGLLNDII